MTEDLDDDVAADWVRARKVPLLDEDGQGAGPRLSIAEIQDLLPQRPPFLFLDEVTAIDETLGLIAARYDPAGWPEVLDSHFPGRPLWPGVLQIEAIGQAGLLLARRRRGGNELAVLIEVLGSTFLRPVAPGGDGVAIVARVVEDGLFFLVIGQCLSGGAVCSASMLRGTFLEE
jgi:3-hydroxyacyl-[acyl-carrier-protein] dehydratase